MNVNLKFTLDFEIFFVFSPVLFVFSPISDTFYRRKESDSGMQIPLESFMRLSVASEA